MIRYEVLILLSLTGFTPEEFSALLPSQAVLGVR